jgi:hypothetical protein
MARIDPVLAFPRFAIPNHITCLPVVSINPRLPYTLRRPKFLPLEVEVLQHSWKHTRVSIRRPGSDNYTGSTCTHHCESDQHKHEFITVSSRDPAENLCTVCYSCLLSFLKISSSILPTFTFETLVSNPFYHRKMRLILGSVAGNMPVVDASSSGQRS